MSLEKVLYQDWDVSSPGPKRRNVNLDPAKPIEEICTKTTILGETSEALVGGNDDSGIHYPSRVAAHALHRSFLNHAEELGLGCRREVCHFVKKERSLIRELQLPPSTPNTGCCPILDAKQLCLEQSLN